MSVVVADAARSGQRCSAVISRLAGFVLIVGARTISVPTEKGKTMETYKIMMLIIVGALEIPAAIILVVGWVRACREARRRNDHD